jgi:hypothetical protein
MKKLATWAWLLLLAGVLLGASEPPMGTGGVKNQVSVGLGWNGIGAGKASFDTVTVLYAFDPFDGERIHSEWEADSLSADLIVDLSEPANEFAFCVVDSAKPNDPYSSIDGTGWVRTTVAPSAAVADRWKLTSLNRRNELTYIPFENDIPARSQIISAVRKQTAAQDINIGINDTLCVTLMTFPADSSWYKSVGTTAPSVGQTRFSHATWQYQTSGLNTQGYPAANGPLWIPGISERDRFWDWGSVSDWSGRPQGSTTLQHSEFEINYLNCVQAATNGEVNNGTALTYSDNFNDNALAELYSWEGSGATSGVPNRPYMVVKYLTMKYVAPYPGGSDWAFAIHSDDGRAKVNQLLADEMGTRDGGRFTMFFNQGGMGFDATYQTWDSVTTWYDEGIVEIGSHSLTHVPADTFVSGGVIDEYTVGMYPLTLTAGATGQDSLLYNYDPKWMFYDAEEAGFGDYTGQPYFGQSFGVPVRNHTPNSQMAWATFGYIAARVLEVDNTTFDADGNLDPYTVSDRYPARADTIYSGFRQNDKNREPRNVRVIANSNGVDDFVGEKTDNPSMDVVAYRTRNIIENSRAQRRGLVGFLLHDVKTGEDSADYDTGIDPDELAAILDVVDDLGGPYVFIGQMGNWFAHYSATIVTPAGYAQPDTYKYTIEEGYWGTFNGVDNTFIPGVR